TGSFASSSIDFGGPQPLSGSIYHKHTVFLAKLSGVNGSYMWATASSSTQGSADPTAVAADKNDNVALTGVFPYDVTFGNTNLIAQGYQDMFVVKFSGTSSLQWAKHCGGTNQNSDLVRSTGIAPDSNGN